jgi:hypothetical protein
MMIPLDQVPPMVKSFVKGLKGMVSEYNPTFTKGSKEAIRNNELYRNKELFDKTGFWLGKDGKWRYEISDYIDFTKPHQERKVSFDYGILANDYLGNGKWKPVKLTELYKNDELYKAVPELKNVSVRLNPDLEGYATGQYLPRKKMIELANSADIKTALHEIQHAVNRIVGSKFKGSSMATEMDFGAKTKSEAFQRYIKNPGEIEARLVEERMEMTPKQQKETPPWVTLDTMLMSEGRIPFKKNYEGGPITNKSFDYSPSHTVY